MRTDFTSSASEFMEKNFLIPASGLILLKSGASGFDVRLKPVWRT